MGKIKKKEFCIIGWLTPPGAVKQFKHYLKNNAETGEFFFENNKLDTCVFPNLVAAQECFIHIELDISRAQPGSKVELEEWIDDPIILEVDSE